jgi:hypothetical protein
MLPLKGVPPRVLRLSALACGTVLVGIAVYLFATKGLSIDWWPLPATVGVIGLALLATSMRFVLPFLAGLLVLLSVAGLLRRFFF